MNPLTILLALAKFLGIDGAKKLSFGIFKWTVRLVVFVVLIGAGFHFGWGNVASLAVALGGAWLLWKGFQRLRRPQSIPEPEERTIDGKTVPDKLAVAAPLVPLQSAGIYDVLCGLPDYGKTLLKLTPGQFDYIPPAPDPAPAPPAQEPWQEPREEKRAPKGVPVLTAARVAVMIWLRTVPRRPALVAGLAVVLIMAGMGAYRQMTFDAWKRGVEQTRQNEVNAVERQVETGKGPEEAKASSLPAGQFDSFLNGLDKNQPQAPSTAPPTITAPAAPMQAPDKQEFTRDPETGQTWTARDNGPEPIEDYDGAERYCKSMNVGGITGWRLPSYNELSNLWKKFGGNVNFHLSQPNEVLWSSTLNDDGVHHTALPIGQIPPEANIYSFTHALCVHDPSQPM